LGEEEEEEEEGGGGGGARCGGWGMWVPPTMPAKEAGWQWG